MARPKYSLKFKVRGQEVRLTVYRLIKMFGWSLAITKLEKVG